MLRKQSKAYDKKLKLVLDEGDTTNSPQILCPISSQPESQIAHETAEDNPPLSELDERLRVALASREPFQRLSFGVSHRKFTPKR